MASEDFPKNVKEHIYKWPFTYDVRKILGAHCLTNRSISHEGDPPLSGALRLHGVGLVLPLPYPADLCTRGVRYASNMD